MRFSWQLSNLALLTAVLLFAACPQSGTEGDTGAAVNPGGSNTPASGGSTQASGWTGDAKDFTFAGYNGSTGQLSDFAGKPLVVNFWATW
jgi:cytochrome oxidase Cu insertion factor (SCO1/SenC/PrrC family)